MNPQIIALMAQANAEGYYRRAREARIPSSKVIGLRDLRDPRDYRVRMQTLAAHHSAGARHAMGLE